MCIFLFGKKHFWHAAELGAFLTVYYRVGYSCSSCCPSFRTNLRILGKFPHCNWDENKSFKSVVLYFIIFLYALKYFNVWSFWEPLNMKARGCKACRPDTFYKYVVENSVICNEFCSTCFKMHRPWRLVLEMD